MATFITPEPLLYESSSALRAYSDTIPDSVPKPDKDDTFYVSCNSTVKNAGNTTKIKRTPEACKACKSAKVKCSGLPFCEHCKKKYMTCEPQENRKPKPASDKTPEHAQQIPNSTQPAICSTYAMSPQDINSSSEQPNTYDNPIPGGEQYQKFVERNRETFCSPIRETATMEEFLIDYGPMDQSAPNLSFEDMVSLLELYHNEKNPFYPMFTFNYLTEQLKNSLENRPAFLSLFFFYALFSRAAMFGSDKIKSLEGQLVKYALSLRNQYINVNQTGNILALVILVNHLNYRKSGKHTTMIWSLSGDAIRQITLLAPRPNDRDSRMISEEYKRTVWCVFVMDRILCTEQDRKFGFEESDIPVDLPVLTEEEANGDDTYNNMRQWVDDFKFVIMMTKALGRSINFNYPLTHNGDIPNNHNPFIFTVDNWILSEYSKCLTGNSTTNSSRNQSEFKRILKNATKPKSSDVQKITRIPKSDGLQFIYVLVNFIILHQPYISPALGILPDTSKMSKNICKLASALIIDAALCMGREAFDSISKSPIIIFGFLSSLRLYSYLMEDKPSKELSYREGVYMNAIAFAMELELFGPGTKLRKILNELQSKHEYAFNGYNQVGFYQGNSFSGGSLVQQTSDETSRQGEREQPSSSTSLKFSFYSEDQNKNQREESLSRSRTKSASPSTRQVKKSKRQRLETVPSDQFSNENTYSQVASNSQYDSSLQGSGSQDNSQSPYQEYSDIQQQATYQQHQPIDRIDPTNPALTSHFTNDNLFNTLYPTTNIPTHLRVCAMCQSYENVLGNINNMAHVNFSNPQGHLDQHLDGRIFAESVYICDICELFHHPNNLSWHAYPGNSSEHTHQNNPDL
ncbi:hypothetical protein CLU79DRAFT_890116 [Phycomyces nitens]|nr:hypothetical protein CLU79DRAFT_890116 [Phycomyces nitens]